MTTDDTGQSDPYGLPVSWDGAQPQESKPELDANGLPVQDQPAKDPTVPLAISLLLTIASPTLGAASAGIAITYQVSHHKLAGHLTGLSAAAGLLVGVLVTFLLPLWWGKMEKYKHEQAIQGIVIVGALLGLIGLGTLWTGTGMGT